MKNKILNQYKLLVNFLGKTLGPSFEVVLHEVKGEEVKMIAIANGEVSDRVLEDTISSETLNILKNKSSHNDENMVNNTVNIKGVEVGLLLKEKEGNIVKGSLRSKERVNVAKIAQCFSGGGHERAAGFTMENTDLAKARVEVLNKIKEFM